MKLLSFFLGVVVAICLVAAAAFVYLFSGGSEITPPVSPGAQQRILVPESPDNVVVKGRITAPALLKDRLQGGTLNVVLLSGDLFPPFQFISTNIKVRNPVYPFEFEFQVPKSQQGATHLSGARGALQVRAIHCPPSVSFESCLLQARPSFQARKFFAPVRGSTIGDSFQGRKKVELGDIPFERDVAEVKVCEGGAPISGTITLMPSAKRRLGNARAVLVAHAPQLNPESFPTKGDLRPLVPDFRTQIVKFQDGKAAFSLGPFEGKNGEIGINAAACPEGQTEEACALEVVSMLRKGVVRIWAPINERLLFTVPPAFRVFARCGETGLNLSGVMDEDMRDPTIPEEVRVLLNSRTALF